MAAQERLKITGVPGNRKLVREPVFLIYRFKYGLGYGY